MRKGKKCETRFIKCKCYVRNSITRKKDGFIPTYYFLCFLHYYHLILHASLKCNRFRNTSVLLGITISLKNILENFIQILHYICKIWFFFNTTGNYYFVKYVTFHIRLKWSVLITFAIIFLIFVAVMKYVSFKVRIG